MNHIKRHAFFMKNEIDLKHIRKEHENRFRNLNNFEKIEKFHTQQEYHNIKTDISPKFYDMKLS